MGCLLALSSWAAAALAGLLFIIMVFCDVILVNIDRFRNGELLLILVSEYCQNWLAGAVIPDIPEFRQ